jgi:aryl-alcohol dehydrogenase-like predicted oxidoreductase
VTATLALGTAQLDLAYGVANRRAGGRTGDPRAILDAARERGIAWIDTAPAYGDAEAIIGRYLRETAGPGTFQVASKLSALPLGLATDAVAAYVARAIDRTRARLAVERVDALLVHDAADLQRYGGALVDALRAACDAGAIARWGVSVYEPGEAVAALASAKGDLGAIQYPFHLLDRRLVESGTTARLARAAVVRFARSALLQGLLVMPATAVPASLAHARPWVERAHALAAHRGMTPFALALGFAVRHAQADHVVLGVDDAAQLHAACDVLEAPFPDALAGEIAAALPDVPEDVRDPRRWPAPESAAR